MSAVALLSLIVLGAVAGADVVSFPQAMISRPIVAATVAGALAGNTLAGLLTGVVLEMLAMETLPVGASRYPEWGSASVVAGAVAASATPHPLGAIVLGATVGIATAWAGGWSMYALRRLNGSWWQRALPELDAGSWRTVAGLQLRGLTADLVRAALLTAIGLLVWLPIVHAIIPHWTMDRRMSHAVLAGVAAAVAGSAAWRQSSGTAGARWYFLGGAALGIAASLLL